MQLSAQWQHFQTYGSTTPAMFHRWSSSCRKARRKAFTVVQSTPITGSYSIAKHATMVNSTAFVSTLSTTSAKTASSRALASARAGRTVTALRATPTSATGVRLAHPGRAAMVPGAIRVQTSRYPAHVHMALAAETAAHIRSISPPHPPSGVRSLTASSAAMRHSRSRTAAAFSTAATISSVST